MIVIACPGQGSQTPGFLGPWLEEPGTAEFLSEASDQIGVDLLAHGTTSDAETIRDTRVAQPLIVAAGLIAARALARRVSFSEAGIAGHSVGEFTAAVLSGVLSEREALRLVDVRARAMAEAALREPSGMAAVIGGDETEVLGAISRQGLTAANRNGAGQIVAAGTLSHLAAFQETPPAGARVIPLQVAGAFHTELMSSAVAPLAAAAAGATPEDPDTVLWTNADGSVVTSGERFVELLVAQLARPVRWDACLRGFEAAGISGLIELAPAGALVGIAKRALRGVPAVAVKSPDDLDAAAALLAGPAS